ncbi:TlpA disulfide reductase family protein [Tuwongella immobilis]|uniref:Thioredoxin domain-containing protein n=1 Tax=Tuwongella immobilis TaxID=692036 RepID=A0A6C2YVT8_9BACT|nr:TlpA disulfide reductase family protein [Tuwongella immobilis]VIP05283.1 Probable thioredoxin OS=Blastopirellula marina DSM 3645 GN=DSM3645_25056 PE=4 SV=1: Thioredoxin_8 [Tuwongella immobilis]VTS07922.1 Probable thioredoxin OS=Blastopirellula marina DSM 3645 GN=DSM3645_25056 PE=4 SV=1: Thioredoxin_8 [Tuwongella immobilis]
MAKRRIGLRLLAVLALSGAWGGMAQAAPTVEQMLAYKPTQPSVKISTPAAAELAGCKVELIKGAKAANGRTPSGWLLRDPRRLPVCCFLDTDGDNHIDVWAYYTDGQESYREVDTNFNQKPDHYRWLGTNGSKWGVDLNEDGRIDSWKSISSEEVSQELLQAVLTKDAARFQALLISKSELDSLELPESEANRIREATAAAVAKFQKTVQTLSALDGKTAWVHLETGAPHCTAADSLGAKQDLIRYKNGTILYENGGKHDWLQTGEIIQVGRAWRLVDGPVPGSRVEEVASNTGVNSNGSIIPVEPEAKPLLEDLKQVDATAPQGNIPAEVIRYNLARAAVLEKIISKSKPEQQEQWLKQLADCLSTASQAGDAGAFTQLGQLRAKLAAASAGSNSAAYVTFREMSAGYALSLSRSSKSDEMVKVQEQWRTSLTKFVADYPSADDTPEAYMQLGMAHEFVGKETEAKNFYGLLVKNFSSHPLANKANGALRRLNLEGKDFELTATKVGGDEPFDVSTLRGKSVLVYYWASWNQQSAADFAKLKAAQAAYQAKGLEIVTVNLDNTAAEAKAFLAQHALTATHIGSQSGGLDSNLANQYGVLVLPNAFLVGKDGKVVSRSVQMATLEDELKKFLGN